MRILLIFLTLIFATELEVDGNLKVTGNVDVQNNPIKNVGIPTDMTDAINGSVLQNALRNDGPFEYKILFLTLDFHNYSGNTSLTSNSRWIELNQMTEGTYFHDIDSFSEEINVLFNDGWALESIEGSSTCWWIFKRPIEEEE